MHSFRCFVMAVDKIDAIHRVEYKHPSLCRKRMVWTVDEVEIPGCSIQISFDDCQAWEEPK